MSFFTKFIACFTGPLVPPNIDENQKTAIQSQVLNNKPLPKKQIDSSSTTPSQISKPQVPQQNVKEKKVVCKGDVCTLEDDEEEEQKPNININFVNDVIEEVSWGGWEEEEEENNDNNSSTGNGASAVNSNNKKEEPVEDEEDYFADMAPDIKPTIVGIIDEKNERESAKKKFAMTDVIFH